MSSGANREIAWNIAIPYNFLNLLMVLVSKSPSEMIADGKKRRERLMDEIHQSEQTLAELQIKVSDYEQSEKDRIAVEINERRTRFQDYEQTEYAKIAAKIDKEKTRYETIVRETSRIIEAAQSKVESAELEIGRLQLELRQSKEAWLAEQENLRTSRRQQLRREEEEIIGNAQKQAEQLVKNALQLKNAEIQNKIDEASRPLKEIEDRIKVAVQERDGLIQQIANLHEAEKKTKAKILELNEQAKAEYETIRANLQQEAQSIVNQERARFMVEIQNLADRINYLETENNTLRDEVDRMTQPRRPPDKSFVNSFAWNIQDLFFDEKQIVLHYHHAILSLDSNQTCIICQFMPDKWSDSKITTFTGYGDRLQGLLSLREPPEVAIVAGTLQFKLLPLEAINTNAPVVATSVVHERSGMGLPKAETEAIAKHLEIEYLRTYLPPTKQILPTGEISADERNWVLRCYFIDQVQALNLIVATVYQNSSGKPCRPGRRDGYWGRAINRTKQILNEAGLRTEDANYGH